LNYFLDAAFFPEPPEDQLRADPYRDRLESPRGMRIDDG
jgi:hypothetical protein